MTFRFCSDGIFISNIENLSMAYKQIIGICQQVFFDLRCMKGIMNGRKKENNKKLFQNLRKDRRSAGRNYHR